MIDLNKLDLTEKPLTEFKAFYNKAVELNQRSIEASCLSTIDIKKKSAHSRYVNIKYINSQEFIFFTNYESKKAKEIKTSSKVALNFYWNMANVQIRIEGNISKINESIYDEHFKTRGDAKNALAISSQQSQCIDSYKNVQINYQSQLGILSSLSKRPAYWGGYSITPYYFEFWEGHESRLNKRSVYEKNLDSWNHYYLQP